MQRVFFCGAVAAPALCLLLRWGMGEWAGELVDDSGLLAALLLFLTLGVTPLSMLFPKSAVVLWLRRHRRWLGVSSFLYSCLHVAFYCVDMETLRNVRLELPSFGIQTGWLAFALLAPLALTSHDAAVRKLGVWWRVLHRLVYAAALAMVFHWVFIHDDALVAMVLTAPLFGLEVYRVLAKISRV